MATMLLTKKITIFSVSKSMPRYAFPRLSTASFSTAYERAEGANAGAEAEGSSEEGAVSREDMYETRQQDWAMSKDPARDGPIKAVEDADMVRDTAKGLESIPRRLTQG